MKYIDARLTVNLIITKTADELKEEYTTNEINKFLEKYQCKTFRDMIELMICKNSNPNIDLNTQKYIDNIESELYDLRLDDTFNRNKIRSFEPIEKRLKDEYIKLTQMAQISTQKISQVETIIKQYEMIMLNNRLDFKTELQKLKSKQIDQNNNIGLGL